MGNDGQLPFDTETYAAVERRNLIRRQVGLQLVEPSREFDRIRQAQELRTFEQWMQSPLRDRVEQTLLDGIRRRTNRPNWRPTGMLSGGGWVFHALLVKQMRKSRERLDR